MVEEIKNSSSNVDPSLLLISGAKGSKDKNRSYSRKISNAIFSCLDKHGIARPRAVGTAAIDNSAWGIAIITSILKNQEKDVVFVPKFTNVILDHSNKTGLVLETFIKENISKPDDFEENENYCIRIKGSPRDETLTIEDIKAINRNYIKKVCNNMISVFEENGFCSLRYVGPTACSNAIKASAIFVEEMKSKNIDVFMQIIFTKVKFDQKEKTGFIINIMKS